MALRITLPSATIVSRWKERHVIKWLKKMNLDDCIPAFENRHIDGLLLLELSEEKLFSYQDLKIKRRSQIAKCVNECKSQATNAKRIVGNIKQSQGKHQKSLNGDGDEESAEDSDYWDTDFEDDLDDELKEENVSELNNNGINVDPTVVEQQPKDTSNVPSTTISRTIPKPPDLPMVPKPIIVNGQNSSPQKSIPRPPLKRPPVQPPPPPVSQSSNWDGPQEDYEIPINPVLSTTLKETTVPSAPLVATRSIVTAMQILPVKSSLIEDTSSIMETYEVIEAPEENYEMVDDSKWSGSSETSSMTSSTSDKPALPPRIPQPISISPPPPPLPQKPRKLQETAQLQKSENLIRSLERPKLPIKADEDLPQEITPASSVFSSLLGRKYTSSPSSSPKLKHHIKDIVENDVLVENNSKSFQNDGPSSRCTTPDVEVSSCCASQTSVISERCSPPPLPPRTGMSFPEDIAQNMATRPLPPVPVLSTSKQQSYIIKKQQEIHLYPWFHEIEREDAEQQLKELGQSGAFLVRPSKRAGQENPYTLTVLHEGKIFHLNVRQRSDELFALGKEKKREKTFLSVADLVAYHQSEPILLTSRGESAGLTSLLSYPSK